MPCGAAGLARDRLSTALEGRGMVRHLPSQYFALHPAKSYWVIISGEGDDVADIVHRQPCLLRLFVETQTRDIVGHSLAGSDKAHTAY